MNNNTYNLNTFKKLEKDFLKARNKEKVRWEKYIKKSLSPYYKITDGDYSNYAGEFYFILELKKGRHQLEISVEDENCGDTDYAVRAFAYKELPQRIEQKLTYVDDEDYCICKSTKVETVISFLIKLSEELK